MEDWKARRLKPNPAGRCHLLGTQTAVLGPFLVMSVYLFLTRWPRDHFTAGSDWILLSLSVGVGIAGLAVLPLDRLEYLAISVLYAVIMSVLLVIYTFLVAFMIDQTPELLPQALFLARA